MMENTIPGHSGESSDRRPRLEPMGAQSAPMGQPPGPTAPESIVYRDAWADARGWSVDQVLAAIEVAHLDLEDPIGDLDQFNAAERLRTYEQVLDQRVRVISRPNSRAAKLAQDREAWAGLAREVRQRVDIVEVLLLIGYPSRPIGREWHGGCPACRAGDDRLLIRSGPEGRCWCRRCGWRADVIEIARLFVPGCRGFRDAVSWLARLGAMEAQP